MSNNNNDLEALNFFKENGNIYHYSRGLDTSESREIKNLIQSAKKNDNPHKTVFPDFICENGWIEHYEITCGPEGEKGSLEKRQQAERDRDIKKQALELAHNTPKGNIAFDCFTATSQGVNAAQGNYRQSFINNWNKHIENYNKALNHDFSFFHYHETGVFLIESHDFFLTVEETNYQNRNFGNLFLGSSSSRNRLGFEPIFDKDLLDFMEKSKDIVQYVLFKGKQSSCVLKTSNIPIIKEYLRNRNFRIGNCIGSCATTAVVSVTGEKEV
jgi:hypothetical protein